MTISLILFPAWMKNGTGLEGLTRMAVTGVEGMARIIGLYSINLLNFILNHILNLHTYPGYKLLIWSKYKLLMDENHIILNLIITLDVTYFYGVFWLQNLRKYYYFHTNTLFWAKLAYTRIEHMATKAALIKQERLVSPWVVFLVES